MTEKYNLEQMRKEIEEDQKVVRQKDLRLSRASLKKLVDEKRRSIRGLHRGE